MNAAPIDRNQLDRFQDHPPALAVASELLIAAQAVDDAKSLLTQVAAAVLRQVGAETVLLARADRGTWQLLDSAGRERSLPVDLMAEVLDGDQGGSKGTWTAAPLTRRGRMNEVLAVCGPAGSRGVPVDTVDALAAAVGVAVTAARASEHRKRRIARLETLLHITSQWNQADDMETLLVQMAEAGTRLLRADRASIFLWDKPNKTLVGRPALGVDGGELRIPDDRGIVGQVVQEGEPRRVDAEDKVEQREIDRHVDEQLGFQTRTLLCVPLRGKGGRLFGAFEMINKLDGNFTDEDERALVELATHAAIVLENTQQYEQLLKRRKQLAEQAAAEVQLIGESPQVEAIRSTAARVAATELAVLILGENGTGKEVVAKLIHYLSDRRDEPFVAVNCAALTETLLESELFGHEKGAFTDAHEARAGKFEVASGGTLFLDEIGDLSPGGQAKLLRVLEEKVVVRVGGSMPIQTDTRVIAATNQDLAKMVRERGFREDLFFRLNVVAIELPPLRERSEDVLLLGDHFLEDFCKKAHRKTPQLTAAARKRLLSHPWPGNVRELRNLMERLAYLSQGDKVDADELAFILAPGDEAAGWNTLNLPLSDATSHFQRQYIEQNIERARGNMSEAAKRLGLHRSNLYRKMRQLGMSDGDEEEA
jgi:Nif-specific regulatory protein